MKQPFNNPQKKKKLQLKNTQIKNFPLFGVNKEWRKRTKIAHMKENENKNKKNKNTQTWRMQLLCIPQHSNA